MTSPWDVPLLSVDEILATCPMSLEWIYGSLPPVESVYFDCRIILWSPEYVGVVMPDGDEWGNPLRWCDSGGMSRWGIGNPHGWWTWLKKGSKPKPEGVKTMAEFHAEAEVASKDLEEMFACDRGHPVGSILSDPDVYGFLVFGTTEATIGAIERSSYVSRLRTGLSSGEISFDHCLEYVRNGLERYEKEGVGYDSKFCVLAVALDTFQEHSVAQQILRFFSEAGSDDCGTVRRVAQCLLKRARVNLQADLVDEFACNYDLSREQARAIVNRTWEYLAGYRF